MKNVKVICISGAPLRHVISRILERLSVSIFQACVFHTGVNDASKCSSDFETVFRQSVSFASTSLSSSFPDGKVLCSAVCQTKSADLNVRVRVANTLLRSTSAVNDWRFISHDNIFFSDLSDNVHLTASGVAKMFRRIHFALRSVFLVDCSV